MNWKVFLIVVALIPVLFYFTPSGIVVAQPTEPATQQLPWTLREHYTFPGGALRLDYAKDNAEWRIKVYQEDSETSRMNPDVVLRTAGFSITLKDGPVLTNDMLGAGGETEMARELYQSALLGEGRTYTVRFVSREDLLVEHTLTTFKRWNFLLLTVKVTNQSDIPKSILKISPAIIPSGAFLGLSEQAISSMRNLKFRGPFPVFGSDGEGTALRIYDPAKPFSFMMAFLPSGFSSCNYKIPPAGNTVEGSFECDYAPGYTLPPNGSLETDPIFISFGIAPAVAQAQYDYLLYDACTPATSGELPRAWVTVPDTEGLSVLCAEAGKAAPAGITHALIPSGWESRPGTLEGGTPKYPRNIAEAARALKNAGSTPGITIDPLQTDKGSGTFTAKSTDGQVWLNLNTQEGRNDAVARLKKLLDKGFSFLIIEPSHIPDVVLEHFGMPRAQADAYAFAAAIEAAAPSKAIVLPSAAASIKATRDELLDAASALVQLRERNIGSSAIKIDMGAASSLDEETMLAFRLWSSPVEFTGAPPRPAHKSLSQVFSQPPLRARAQDLPRKTPLTWLLMPENAARGGASDVVFSFSGAPGWETTALENSNNAPAEASILWQPIDGRIALLSDGRVPPSEKFSVFGLISNPAQPALAGISGTPFLGVDRVKKCAWDATTRVLSGEISGLTAANPTAHIFVPKTYTVASATMNGKRFNPDINSQWLTLPLQSGGANFIINFSTR